MEIVEQLFQLLLEGFEGIAEPGGTRTKGMEQILKLTLHQMGRPPRMQRNHPHGLVEAATGGLQGVLRHLGPAPLNLRKQRIETLADLIGRRLQRGF